MRDRTTIDVSNCSLVVSMDDSGDVLVRLLSWLFQKVSNDLYKKVDKAQN